MVVFFLSMNAWGAAGSQGKRRAGRRSRGARQPAESFRNRVRAARVQRVAAQEPAAGQPQPGQQAVALERLDRVMRAGRMKTAAAAGAEEQRQHRREHKLVEPHQADGQQPRPTPDHPAEPAPGRGRALTAGLTVRRQFCEGFSGNVSQGRQCRPWASKAGPRRSRRGRAEAHAGGGDRGRARSACSGCAPPRHPQPAKRRPPTGPAGRRGDRAPKAGTTRHQSGARPPAQPRNRRCGGRVAPNRGEGGPAGRQTTVRRLRPLARRAASTLRPPRVDLRARYPIWRARFFLCGR